MNVQRKRQRARIKKQMFAQQRHEAAARAGLSPTSGFNAVDLRASNHIQTFDYDTIGWKRRNQPYEVIMD